MRQAVLVALVLLVLPAPTRADEAAPAAGKAGDAFEELLPLLLDEEVAGQFARASASKRAELMEKARPRYAAHQLAQFRWIGENLREGGSPVNHRAAVMLVMGPPTRIHREASRTWPATAAADVANPRALMTMLREGPASATGSVSGSLPTEIWVYPADRPDQMTLVWFVDEGSDGTFRFVKREVVAVTTPVSETAGVEPPAELFAAEIPAGEIAALPVLTNDALPVKIRRDEFKAAQGRTFERFVVVVDPSDVDIELGQQPDTFRAAAKAWLRVEQGGTPVYQLELPLSSAEARPGEPWMVEFGVPLPAGPHVVTAVVESAGVGGKASETVDVTAFAGGLAISSVVVTRMSLDAAGQPALPRADKPAEGADRVPFQIGTYVARPHATGTFKRGDVLGLFVQVYNDAPSANITYRLNREGTFQFETDPAVLSPLPATEIYPLEITKDFTDGAYQLVLTVSDPKSPAKVVKREVAFRVKG